MIDAIVQPILDFFSFFHWLFANLRVIFAALLSPISYIFAVIRFIWQYAFGVPPSSDLSYTFTPQIMSIFNSLPHWPSFSKILGALIVMLAGIAILKLFIHS